MFITEIQKVNHSGMESSTNLLHVWKASGEVLCVKPVEELSDVRTLKRHLQELCGLPRFRQRLLHGHLILDDDDKLSSPLHLQLLLVPFCSTSYEQVIELHTAATEGLVSKLEEILHRPQNPDLQPEDGSDWDSDEDSSDLGLVRTHPLEFAAREGHLQIVKLLLEAGADKDACWGGDSYTSTPLCAASASGHLEIVRLLLQCAARPNGLGKSYASRPLGCASDAGQLGIVRMLLDARADKDANDDRGETALGKASRGGHVEIAQLLVEAGADVDGFEDTFPAPWFARQPGPPLCLASLAGHVDIVRLLLLARAFTETRSRSGETPLGAASQGGHVEIARMLLAAFADINVFDNGGETPLSVASWHGHLAVAGLLLENGADRDAFDEHAASEKMPLHGWIRGQGRFGSPLWAAADRGFPEIVSLLLFAGASTESRSRQATTPLLAACRERRCEIARMLLEAGADKDASDCNGETPLSAASSIGSADIVHLLLEAGASCTMRNQDGDTAYDQARRQGHVQICKLLGTRFVNMQPPGISNKRRR